MGAQFHAVSRTATRDPPKYRARPSTERSVLFAVILLALFVLSAAFAAQRKDVTRGFDELAHASYVAQLQQSGEIWPALGALRMLDSTFRFTAAPNYLNHPPLYYGLLARLGPRIEGNPGALLAHRLLNVLFAVIGLAALFAIGPAAGLRPPELYALWVPLIAIPVLPQLAGAINNDNAAFAGGAVAAFAAFRLFDTGALRWLLLVLAGMVAASLAKLTGLLLVGGFVGGLVILLAWRGQLPRAWIVPIAIAGLLAAAPYAIFIIQYGSPAPETSAQFAMLASGAREAGWADAPPRSLPAFAASFLVAFLADWMPVLAQRNALQTALLVLPLIAVLIGIAGICCSARRLIKRSGKALDVVVVAGALAIAATLAAHVYFSWQRHLATGWMMDAYPRYYLPLIVVIPLAGLSLAAAIGDARKRKLLIGFLILAPLLFRLFGGPIVA